MNILIFEPTGLWQTHTGTACDIAQGHINDGDNVTILECYRDVDACYTNPNNRIDKCFKCIANRNAFFSNLEGDFERDDFLNLTDHDQRLLKNLPTKFDDLDAIKSLKIDNLDLGYAALSSLISYLRDPQPNLDEYTDRINKHIHACYSTYLSLLNHLKAKHYDRVYVFNGRYELARGALRACQKLAVDCHLHDRGNDSQHYATYINALPHDLEENYRQIIEKWENTDASQREQLGSAFFELNKKGVERNWRSFTTQQDPDLLPDTWSDDKYNIVIFNSSQDEFEAIGEEFKLKLYRDQADGIKQIAESLSQHPEIDLWLRIHPNLTGINNDSIKNILTIDKSTISIIPAESEISSYRLIDEADLIITFGSTVGAEATYWGTPSVLLGTSFYEQLNCAYKPQSHNEAIALLTSKPNPLPKTEAIKYGLFRHTFGHPFRFYEQYGPPTNFSSYKLNGKTVHKSIVDRIFIQLARWSWGLKFAKNHYLKHDKNTHRA